MTIDEAIKYADMMALDVLPLDDMPEICAFGELCAAALRLPPMLCRWCMGGGCLFTAKLRAIFSIAPPVR